jgi:hypothetical protein
MKAVRVLATPVTVEASGPIDLATAKEAFFDITMEAMQDYLNSYLGSVLEEFNMKITFHQSQTAVQAVGVTGSTVLVKSYFVLEMDFKVASDSVAILQAFSQSKATDLVKGMFIGTARDKLLTALDEAGIRLESIRVVNADLVTDGTGDVAATAPPVSDTGEAGQTTADNEEESSGGSNTLLYAGVASAAVVAFGAVALYIAHRRRNRGWFDNAEESIEQSLYSNGGHGPPNGKVLPVLTPNGVSTTKTSKTSLGSSQTSTRSRVKPAALTLRNKQNVKSQGSVSTLGSFMALNPVLESLGFEDDGSEEKEDEETARLRWRFGANDAPASNRSNFGTNYSYDGETQPSFRDLESSGQPRGQNSTWSVDGLTVDDDSEAERIIDDARRRRWQDNSGASALGSLPDHGSELGYYEGSNTYYEGSASSLGPLD